MSLENMNIIELMLFLTKLTSKPIRGIYFPEVKADQPCSGRADVISCHTDVGNGCRIHVLVRLPVDLLDHRLCMVKFKWQVRKGKVYGINNQNLDSHLKLEDD